MDQETAKLMAIIETLRAQIARKDAPLAIHEPKPRQLQRPITGSWKQEISDRTNHLRQGIAKQMRNRLMAQIAELRALS